MNVVGLITEYNPFHNGHLYHIEQAKRITNADYVVVVMSGNFVQRGAPAIVDKYTRTKMALSCGADLVLELPVYYATASAELFALGAITTLESLGCVTSICFGSECGNLALLQKIASILAKESDSFRNSLSSNLKLGHSFPKARNIALMEELAKKEPLATTLSELEEILMSPNNILGIEYLKALINIQSFMIPYTITRTTNNYHSTQLDPALSSASAIRKAYSSGNFTPIRTQIPEHAYSHLEASTNITMPIIDHDFSSLLYYKLLYSTKEQLTQYLDISDELADRISSRLSSFTSFEQFAWEIKSKNITLTRVYRSLLHIMLNIKKEDLSHLKEQYRPSYLRILGLRKEASLLINKKNRTSTIPIITKVSAAKSVLDSSSLQLFDLDIKASHLYNHICMQKFACSLTNEYQHGPILFP